MMLGADAEDPVPEQRVECSLTVTLAWQLVYLLEKVFDWMFDVTCDLPG
jgi:hypothetical protein